MSLLKRKRGSVLDLIPLLLILLGFGVTIAIGFTLLDNINTQGALDQTTESADIIDEAVVQFTVFDILFAAAFFGLGLSTILTATLVRLKPIFFFLSLILFSIVIAVGAISANVFESVTGNAQITASSTNFPIMFHVMSHLLTYIVVFGALISIALYTQVGSDVI